MLRRLLCVVLLSLPVVVGADQVPGRLTFSATLESIKIFGRPDEVVTRQFRLTLDADQPVTRFRSKVEDWWRNEEGTQSFYAPAGTLARSCARWVDINPVDATVSPGETLVVRMTVRVPHEVPNGGFWCALTVDEIPDPEAPREGVGVKFLASVSTGIYVYLGNVNQAASIVDLGVDLTRATVRVRNDGNTPLGVEGRIEFLVADGEEPVAVATLVRGVLLTEPVTEVLMGAALPSPAELPAGEYLMRAILDFGGDHFIGAERSVTVTRGSDDGGTDP